MTAKRILGLTAAALSFALLVTGSRASAQDFEAEAPADQTAPAEESLYRSASPRKHAPTYAQEKSMARGQQRMARLDAMRWYGFSNSRPTAASMPYTSMYSPAWQQPGGRPFAWHTSSRPILIYEAPTYR